MFEVIVPNVAIVWVCLTLDCEDYSLQQKRTRCKCQQTLVK